MIRTPTWWWQPVLMPVLALVLGLARIARASEPPLTLDEVLERISQHPGLQGTEQKIEAARGKRLSARGAFDPKLVARGTVQPVGYYENAWVDVKVEQATPLWGTVLFAGWRLGQGEFPVYDGKLETARGGELRAGVRVPLWRDGLVDRNRTTRSQAELEVRRAEREADAKQLELQLKAAKTYWSWVGARQRLDVVEQLLHMAEARQAGLVRQVDAGAVPELEAIDNERSIADRRLDGVSARRKLDTAAVELSLYLRDAEGRPVVPPRGRAPTTLPTPPAAPEASPEALVPKALERRPELLALEHAQSVAELEARWARNQRAPDVALQGYVARDLGPGPTSLLPPELALSLTLELPVPLRKARGQLQTALAEVSRVRAERRLWSDVIGIELRTADLRLRAAIDALALADRQAELAERVAEAERRRLSLGASNVLTVNLREQAAAEAATKRIDAAIEAQVAHAEHRVAQGLPPVR
ncbi:TolC family protein [Paraliomyxa miuraensis]|uniref:TolC family protein n=1 Tax=Paraliomyxa miuraensis TaxID=376150 RepID=UPI002256B42C|nr:TolC family protein [Paraliomyxa miuraensis]MCX4239318.1 TolC family protein [Paraliomyxa miuraensis]